MAVGLLCRYRRFIHARDGASAVEFAIVAPLFIVLLVGILVYGIYFGTAISVSQLAAESARASIAGLDDTERAQLAVARANEFVSGHAFLAPDRIQVVAAPDPGNQQTFVVAVSYDASSLPIFGFASLVPTPAPTITRTSSVRRGGF